MAWSFNIGIERSPRNQARTERSEKPKVLMISLTVGIPAGLGAFFPIYQACSVTIRCTLEGLTP